MVFSFETSVCLNLMRADFLEQGWLENVQQRNLREIGSVTDSKIAGSGTITFHLQIGELRTPMIFGVVDKLAALVLLRATFIDKIIKSMHPAERKTVPYYTALALHLMVLKAKNEPLKKTSDVH